MNKIVVLPLMMLGLFSMVGCTDGESIAGSNMYKTVSEKNMPSFCKHVVAKELGVYAGNLYIYPTVEYDRGAKLVYGRYSVDSHNLKEFACIFNNNGIYAGIKMHHSNKKNKLCAVE